jgi:hypothetical protein
MIIRDILSLAAGLLVFWAFIPYGRDILRGKVSPARSARLMFAVLMIVAILQQHSLGAGLTLAVSLGEAAGSLAILFLSIKYGMGGLRRLDTLCYGLLALDIVVWVTTGNALLALYLSIIADVIAFFPTLHKTWVNPASETAFFFATGIAAPLLNLAAVGHFTYKVALYPIALAIENTIEVALIYRKQFSLTFDKD